MSEAHSVLFDPNESYYQGQDNLQYYQGEYSQDSSAVSPTYGYQTTNSQEYDTYAYPPPAGAPQVQVSFLAAFGSGGLPELDINFDHVKTKTFAVLNPLKPVDSHMMDDVDLVGPLIFCLLLGLALLFTGRIQFGYIYGVAMVGCVSIYCILNLMSRDGIDFYRTASVLGYCLLPIVFLAVISSLLRLRDSSEQISTILSPFIVGWATFAAAKIFVSVLVMHDQRLLVAYPVALFYTCFSLITIF
ncbi:hypothetical protein DSO57_1026563 [Entomophthora muscae]|uniref:Uncharacterized protein n=1 Tax=Entomophthora muscae TaxID=34485 RepID=A0ACC2TDJ3_9FUNG|nr:hypothetical protein DSO57_1026563 [Entomophthora muscae]